MSIRRKIAESSLIVSLWSIASKFIGLAYIIMISKYLDAEGFGILLTPPIHQNSAVEGTTKFSNVDSYKLTMTRNNNAGLNADSGVTHSKFVVVVETDQYYPEYTRYFYDGTQFPTATIGYIEGASVIAANKRFIIELKDARIVGIDTYMENGRSFAELTFTYTGLSWAYYDRSSTEGIVPSAQNRATIIW